MKLGAYLKRAKLSQAAFAKLAGTNQGHISELVRGQIRPTLATVERIWRASGKQVDLMDWSIGRGKGAKP